MSACMCFVNANLKELHMFYRMLYECMSCVQVLVELCVEAFGTEDPILCAGSGASLPKKKL